MEIYEKNPTAANTFKHLVTYGIMIILSSFCTYLKTDKYSCALLFIMLPSAAFYCQNDSFEFFIM